MTNDETSDTSPAILHATANITQWSDYSTDKFMAPEMSKFTSATIADMSQVDPEQNYWQANYILNTVLGSIVPSPRRQQLFNFLRRCHSAFSEYAHARESTLIFLSERQRVLKYMDAIGHWEAYLAYSWQGYRLLVPQPTKLFQVGDDSVLERLHALHSRAKHADEHLFSGDLLEDSPLCVWLTNEGLRSTETSLSFGEMSSILEDLAQWASAVQDPKTMNEKVRSILSSNSDESRS
ncbi:MAG: hypothetical protein ACYC1I_09295 [Acidimicrobiales bacterium]